MQYLYCNSSSPHQLQGIYPTTATCSNPGTANYAVQYDSWGNVSQRTYNGQTATLSYDKLDQLVEWQVPSTNQAWYAYDANGDRSIQRSSVGSTTSMTVYAFGLEEYTYDGSGNLQSSTHYYTLAGHLIGELTGSGTPSTLFFMTDALGSILATFSNTTGSAAMLGNQLYQSGSMNTTKGYTGQYNDPVTGLDYYNSRYYDPVAGVFLSPDLTQNNEEGMNPYSYVGCNPETDSDPTGQAFVPPGSGSSGDSGSSQTTAPAQNNSSYTCAWYDLGCTAHYVWNVTWKSTVPPLQKAWNETSSALQKGWNTDVKGWDTSVQFAQQAEQVLIRTASGIAAKVIAPVVAAVALAIVLVAAMIYSSGSSNGGWNDNQQRKVAYKLAQQVQQKRGKDTRKAPYAQGCIGIGSNPCTEDSKVVPGFGQDNNLFHAERQIYSWAKNMIETQYQNAAPGTTINVMIYVQDIPCGEFCRYDIPVWAKALQAAAPPGVKVNLYVWYQPGFDKDHPLDNPITSPRDISRFYPSYLP